MASRRRTRAGGGSTSGSSAAAGSTGDMESSLLNESFEGLDPNDLLQMLGGDDDEEEHAGEGDDDEYDEEDEERDIVTALDGKFLGAIAPPEKRKRSEGGESTTIADSATAAATAAAERGGSVAGPAARAAPGGRIKTILRVRPVGAEAGPLSLTVNHGSRTTVTTLRPATETRGPLSESFVCDRVMDASAVQEDIYPETAGPLVAKLFEGPGESAQLFAYGASGSGKSHTLWGPRDVGVDSGVIPRVLEDVFGRLRVGGGGGDESGQPPCLSLRALEIYKDKAFDLLPREGDKPRQVRVIQTHNQVVYEGLEEHWPATSAEALDLTKKVRKRVRVRPTKLNSKSSRSHTVLMLRLHRESSSRNGGRGSSIPSRGHLRERGSTTAPDTAAAAAAADGPVLYLVDLAGSERLGRSQSDKVEALNINLDISDLFGKFKEMENGAGAVVCRTRTLTCVLKRMFVRPAATISSSSSSAFRTNCVMIVAVNPAVKEYGETQKVLSNSQLSSRVIPVEAPLPPSAVRAQFEYGMNGHLLKRQKTSHGGGAAVGGTREGKYKGVPTAAASAGRPVPRDARVLETERMRERIEQLEVECARLQDEKDRLEEEHEAKLERVESETFRLAAEERHEAEQELEREVADLRGTIRELKEELESKSPVGKAIRAVVAQSERKQAAVRAETARRLERATTREADDEAARQSHARACAEENLAAALTQLSEQKVHAQKEAARADDAEAVAAQLREDQSAERAERAGLEVEVERLKVAAKAEADGRAEVEKELREAREEITRLENEREAAAAVSVDGSGSESGNGSGSRRINSLASGTSSLSESGATGDEEERSEASTVGMIDDCGNDNSIDLGEEEEDSSAAEGDERQRRLGSKAASVAAASPALAGSASGEEVEGRDSATSDDPEEDHKSSEILPKKRTRRRLGQVEAEAKLSGGTRQLKEKDRQPLRSLRNGDVNADNKENAASALPRGKSGRKAAVKSVGGSKNKESEAMMTDAESNEESTVEEEGEEKSIRTRGAAQGKRKKVGQGKSAKATGDSETQRCREMRRNARMRSPEVVVLTEKQAKNVDAAKKIVKERRRLRGGR